MELGAIVFFLLVICPCGFSLSLKGSKLFEYLGSKRKADFPFVAKNRDIEMLVSEVEASGCNEQLMFPQLWKRLEGDWELVYTDNAVSVSSSFASSMFPVPQLKSVKQVIYNAPSKAIQHVLQFSSFSVTLSHSVDVQSNCSPAQVYLDLDSIETSLPIPPFSLEKVIPFNLLRRGYFDVSE